MRGTGRRGALVAVVVVMIGGSGACAQTLTAPSVHKPPPPRAAKAPTKTGDSAKACRDFGIGFVQLPGSDACVKIGGGVTMEGTVNR